MLFRLAARITIPALAIFSLIGLLLPYETQASACRLDSEASSQKDQFVFRSAYADGLLYVSINQGQVWEAGEGSSDTTRRLVDSLCLSIDGSYARVWRTTDLPVVIMRYDDRGILIGSHGGAISFDFPLAGLVSGRHSAIISFKTGDGRRVYSAWTFDVR